MTQIALAVDQLANTLGRPVLDWLTGVPTDHDETISSRLGKALTLKDRKCRLCRWICHGINVFDYRWWMRDGFDHCVEAIEHDEGMRVPDDHFEA